MAENLMPTVIFLGTFLLTGGLLIAGLNVLVTANQSAQSPNSPEQIIGGDVFTLLEWTAAPNGTVTPDVIITLHSKYFAHGFPEHQKIYSYAGKRDVYCYVIRDSTVRDKWEETLNLEDVQAKDYVIFYQNKHIYWGLGHRYMAEVIPLDIIIEKKRADLNFSDVDFKLYQYFTVRFHTGPGMNFTTGIMNNYYNITLGMSLNSSISSMGPWGMVGAFLSFRLPNIDPVLNLLIAVPIWLALGFMILTVISRFIPLVPGG